MKLKNIILLIIIGTVLTSCNTPFGHIGKCPDADLKWTDILKINDIKYEHCFSGSADEKMDLIEKGQKLGEVSFMMADKACSDHKIKMVMPRFLK